MNRGSCLCGAVQFETGLLSTMVHCHCSMCRKHHGSMFATFLTAPLEGFRWLSGEDRIVNYRSSERGLRPFCGTCGSAVPAPFAHMGVVFVPAGSVEGDPGARPMLHMFAGSRASWYPIADALPQYEAFPPEFGGGESVDNLPLPARIDVIQGRCLCGDIAWTLAGEPERAWNCHCSRCRRARSAAHATNAFIRQELLSWTRGGKNVASYALPGAKRFGQDFCPRCGSAVPRVVVSTGYVVVPCGSLESPLTKGPLGHIFVSSKAPWFEISDGLPQWETLPA